MRQMISKSKKTTIVAVLAVIAVLGFTGFTYNQELEKARAEINSVQERNEKLLVRQEIQEQVINDQSNEIKFLRSENMELSSRVEEMESRRSQTEVSRGGITRTMTLEVTGYSADGGDGYCPSNVMANGETVHVGAAAMNGVPFGTRIYVPDLDRTVVVKDRCGHDGVLDIYCDTTEECYQIGRRTLEVHFLD